MVDQPQPAVIRVPGPTAAARLIGLTGCVIGAGIALSGHLLANMAADADSLTRSTLLEDNARLRDALADLSLAAPRQRLQELAELPLLPEFIEATTRDPDSVDAQELAAYLQDVIAVTGRETGLVRLDLQSGGGDVLLTFTGPGDTSDAPAQHIVADVAGLAPGSKVSGRLVGTLSGARPEALPSGAGTVFDSTASLDAGRPAAAFVDTPTTIRLFAWLAGLTTALFGLSIGALARRSSSGRT